MHFSHNPTITKITTILIGFNLNIANCLRMSGNNSTDLANGSRSKDERPVRSRAFLDGLRKDDIVMVENMPGGPES